MRGFFIIGVACAALIGAAPNARAASESTLTGVAIGAGTGALVAGPIGVVAGGVIGGVVGRAEGVQSPQALLVGPARRSPLPLALNNRG